MFLWKLCRLFLKHAPNSARASKQRWGHQTKQCHITSVVFQSTETKLTPRRSSERNASLPSLRRARRRHLAETADVDMDVGDKREPPPRQQRSKPCRSNSEHRTSPALSHSAAQARADATRHRCFGGNRRNAKQNFTVSPLDVSLGHACGDEGEEQRRQQDAGSWNRIELRSVII